jgi:hypothetical protein
MAAPRVGVSAMQPRQSGMSHWRTCVLTNSVADVSRLPHGHRREDGVQESSECCRAENRRPGQNIETA